MPSLRSRAALVAELAETWIRRPSGPNRMVVSLTRRCNLRCSMCFTWKTPPEHEAMTPAQLGQILDQTPKLRWLDVTGGEIFIRKDAEQLFEAITAHSPKLRILHFPTNGWFTERVVQTVKDIHQRRPGLDLIITVSLDGPEEVHDRIRGRKGSFRRALETFRQLHVLPGVSTYIGTTVTRDSEDTLDALGETLQREIPNFSPRDWHWNWAQESQQFFQNEDATIQARQAADLVRVHARRRGAPRNPVDLMELGFLLTLDSWLRGEPTGVPCQALRSTCFISPEGDLYPCHVWDRPLGNVFDTPLQTLWNAPETLVARSEVESLACGGCFTPCEAYPALAGAPLAAARSTIKGAVRILGQRTQDSSQGKDGR